MAQIHTTVQFNKQILDLSIQRHGGVIILLQKELINNKAKKGYLTRSTTTRSLQKELINLINNRDIRRIKNDNSEDKILSITNDFKKYKITHLTRPNELGTTTSKVAKRNPDTARLWNDYVYQIATR